MKLHRILAALATALFLLAGCSGSSAATNENANYVDVGSADSGYAGSNGSDSTVVGAPGGPAAVVAVATEPVAATAVNETTLEELTSIYDTYLSVRSKVIISEREVTDLGDVATQAGMDQVAGLRIDSTVAHSEGKYSAMTGLNEWSNVTTIHERGADYVFIDCTERQEVNSVGIPHLRFVTNEVRMVPSDGAYKVANVTELQSGLFAAFVGDFGCVPPSFIERAETVATHAITEVAAMIADPASAVAEGVTDTFTDEAHEELTYIVDLLNDQNLSRTPDESIEIKVVGMDTNKPEFTVIVSVCRYYPNGRTYIDGDTGQAGVSDLARGSSEEEWLYVQVEPVPQGPSVTDVVTRVESQNSNCWEA